MSIPENVLLAEAVSLSVKAVQCNVAISDHEELRGGVPTRRFLQFIGQRSARCILQSAWLLNFLREITHPSLAPTGVLGTYSYYARPGNYPASQCFGIAYFSLNYPHTREPNRLGRNSRDQHPRKAHLRARHAGTERSHDRRPVPVARRGTACYKGASAAVAADALTGGTPHVPLVRPPWCRRPAGRCRAGPLECPVLRAGPAGSGRGPREPGHQRGRRGRRDRRVQAQGGRAHDQAALPEHRRASSFLLY